MLLWVMIRRERLRIAAAITGVFGTARAAWGMPWLQEKGKSQARAPHPALDRANGAAKPFGRLLLGETCRAHQRQRLSLRRREGRHRRQKLRQRHSVLLRWRLRESARKLAVDILDLTPPLSNVRQEGVPQDGVKPRAEVRVRNVAGPLGPGLGKRLLHHVLRAMPVPGQVHGMALQAGDLVPELRVKRVLLVRRCGWSETTGRTVGRRQGRIVTHLLILSDWLSACFP